jgi:hypothetical protein
MLDSPDFELEFYDEQNRMMMERYVVVFKKWKIPWKTYVKDVEKRLRNRKYWLWSYLVGIEKFIQDMGENVPSKELVEKDKDSRISRIVGDFYKVEQYIRNL